MATFAPHGALQRQISELDFFVYLKKKGGGGEILGDNWTSVDLNETSALGKRDLTDDLFCFWGMFLILKWRSDRREVKYMTIALKTKT